MKTAHDKSALLVPISEAELDQTRIWANDPELKRSILRVSPVSSEDQKRWFGRLKADDSRLVFALKTAAGLHIGNTGFYHWDSIHSRAEFWLLLGDRRYWGKGIGSFVLERMLQFGFNELGLHKIYLNVGEDNLPARNLYRKFGFREDGVLREHYFMESRYIHVIQMSLLRHEYPASKMDPGV